MKLLALAAPLVLCAVLAACWLDCRIEPAPRVPEPPSDSAGEVYARLLESGRI